MSEERAPKQTKDYLEETKTLIPLLTDAVERGEKKLDDVLEEMKALEKKTRLAADARSTAEIAAAIVTLCFKNNQWAALNENIQFLVKRRAQLQKVVIRIVDESMKFISKAPSRDIRLELIKTLRLVSDGRMYVELERARLTQSLAEIKEAEGKTSEACSIMQEMTVETIGAMEVHEKYHFLLEQLRLCLETSDYIRAELMGKKVNSKTIGGKDMQDLKLTFLGLMVRFHLHSGNYLDVCKCFRDTFHTEIVQADRQKWAEALKKAVLFIILAPFDAEVSDILHHLYSEKQLLQLPLCKDLLDRFKADELISWPLKNEGEWKSDSTFTEDPEAGAKRWKDFHKRVIQHNVRVVSKFFTRITMARFAELLQQDSDLAETYLSEMVSSKQLFAKIDRPNGVIVFARKEESAEQVENWSADIEQLLSLVEETCHLINKEKLKHGVEDDHKGPER